MSCFTVIKMFILRIIVLKNGFKKCKIDVTLDLVFIIQFLEIINTDRLILITKIF